MENCNLLCRFVVRCYVISFVFAGLVFLGGYENGDFGKIQGLGMLLKIVGTIGGLVYGFCRMLSADMEFRMNLYYLLLLIVALVIFWFLPLSGIMFLVVVVFWFCTFLVQIVYEDLQKRGR